MKIDPLTVALKEIAEARTLLENVVISSEQFDYPKAKEALGELRKKIKALAITKAHLDQLLKQRDPKIRVIDFRATSRPSAQP
jgi:hypothetical protein